MVRLSIVGCDCVHCGTTMGVSLKCPGCGWIDPLTRKPSLQKLDQQEKADAAKIMCLACEFAGEAAFAGARHSHRQEER